MKMIMKKLQWLCLILRFKTIIKLILFKNCFKYDVNCVFELIKYPFGFSDHTLPAIFTGMRSKLPKKNEARRKFVSFIYLIFFIYFN